LVEKVIVWRGFEKEVPERVFKEVFWLVVIEIEATSIFVLFEQDARKP
jgi:hypothetical protein